MLSRDDISRMIRGGTEGLRERADAERRRLCGDEVHLRGIVEFSNVCSRDCLYCGLRRSNARLSRYSMGPDEIVAAAEAAFREGVRTIVLQSGENDAMTAERMAGIVAAVKERLDVAVTLCVGARSEELYRACREAGADRYLLRHETANARLHAELRPDSSLEDRLGALRTLRRLGYQVGCGSMIGLPGQTADDLADDLLLAREMDADMAGFGPFVPHPDTPLGGESAGDIELSLRVFAAARLVLGPVHLPATCAMDAIHPDGRQSALQWGANVIMADVTPMEYRSLYAIYPFERSQNSIERVKAILERLGRPLGTGRGDSLKRGGAREPARSGRRR